MSCDEKFQECVDDAHIEAEIVEAYSDYGYGMNEVGQEYYTIQEWKGSLHVEWVVVSEEDIPAPGQSFEAETADFKWLEFLEVKGTRRIEEAATGERWFCALYSYCAQRALVD
jgi:hypothetical protein